MDDILKRIAVVRGGYQPGAVVQLGFRQSHPVTHAQRLTNLPPQVFPGGLARDTSYQFPHNPAEGSGVIAVAAPGFPIGRLGGDG